MLGQYPSACAPSFYMQEEGTDKLFKARCHSGPLLLTGPCSLLPAMLHLHSNKLFVCACCCVNMCRCLQEGIDKFFEAAQAAKAALEEATPLLEEATALTKEITPLLQVGWRAGSCWGRRAVALVLHVLAVLPCRRSCLHGAVLLSIV